MDICIQLQICMSTSYMRVQAFHLGISTKAAARQFCHIPHYMQMYLICSEIWDSAFEQGFREAWNSLYSQPGVDIVFPCSVYNPYSQISWHLINVLLSYLKNCISSVYFSLYIYELIL